jgi:phosphoenolpyruvate carboxylase
MASAGEAIGPEEPYAPRCMSTQHPDNVAMPIFASGTVMTADDEVREAFYAFSDLGCDEQLWDYEGKEVDNFVVEKLLATYGDYFRREPLGARLRLTPRVPNPRLERAQAKGLLEVLHSLPRHADAARMFYGAERPPIVEVIFPMTTSADELNWIRDYYRRYVIGVQSERVGDVTATFRDWLGEFEPQDISVIPLVEDLPYLLSADEIVGAYIWAKGLRSQRVFVARSDPALNYGMIPAVIATVTALDKLGTLERTSGVQILPILGAGGAPFRGGLQPDRVERVMALYPSVQTFTLQSAFKYDHSPGEVRGAIEALHRRQRAAPVEIAGDLRLAEIMTRASARYREELRAIAPLVSKLAPLVPKRRLRKLHIGLFGYGRDAADLALPRAITFCAGLTSIGLPPEVLGLAGLSDDDWTYTCARLPQLHDEIAAALPWLDGSVAADLPESVRESVRVAGRRFDLAALRNDQHLELSRAVRKSVLEGGPSGGSTELVVRAASVRHYLG